MTRREKSTARVKKYFATPKGKYARYSFSAKRRGIAFNLTLEEFSSLVEKTCSYCGTKDYVGVDRMDNDKGYSIENSTPCCTTCNMMKKTLPLEVFIEHCKKVSLFNQ